MGLTRCRNATHLVGALLVLQGGGVRRVRPGRVARAPPPSQRRWACIALQSSAAFLVLATRAVEGTSTPSTPATVARASSRARLPPALSFDAVVPSRHWSSRHLPRHPHPLRANSLAAPSLTAASPLLSFLLPRPVLRSPFPPPLTPLRPLSCPQSVA